MHLHRRIASFVVMSRIEPLAIRSGLIFVAVVSAACSTTNTPGHMDSGDLADVTDGGTDEGIDADAANDLGDAADGDFRPWAFAIEGGGAIWDYGPAVKRLCDGSTLSGDIASVRQCPASAQPARWNMNNSGDGYSIQVDVAVPGWAFDHWDGDCLKYFQLSLPTSSYVTLSVPPQARQPVSCVAYYARK